MITEFFHFVYSQSVDLYHTICGHEGITFPQSRITVKITGRRSTNLGEGAFSTVYKVKDVRNNRKYALKQMIIQSSEYKQIATVEVEAFRMFHHPHLLKLIDSIETTYHGNNTVFLLLPYCSKGSLRNWLGNVLEGKVKRPGVIRVLSDFKSICEALIVLHNFQPPYVHQDIKPENVLLDDQNKPLLTDFGSVRKAEIPIRTRKDILQVTEDAAQFCTASYRSPELYDPPKDIPLDTRTDVWAMGCLLFAWWFGYSPFESEFIGNSIRVTECSALRVLANIPKKANRSAEDEIIYEIVEWILEKEMIRRPFLIDVIHRLEDTISTHQTQKGGNSTVKDASTDKNADNYV